MISTTRRRRLTAVCCALMFAYGCFLGASQTVIGAVADDMGMDMGGMGAIVSLQFLPALFMPVLMGRLGDRIGRRPILACFCAMFGIGLVVCGLSRSVWIYGFGIVAIGSGYSVCESGSCAAMSDLGPEWGERGINLCQAMLCLGAVLSPIIVRAFDLNWRVAYFLCAGCYAAILPLLLLQRFPSPRVAQTGERGAVHLLLSSGAFWCLLVGVLLYVGMESGFGYFIESLISERFGTTTVSCVSLYWLGMMLSRFLFFVLTYPPKPVIIGGFALSGVIFTALCLSWLPALSLALCFATGFAFGPVWSTLVAQANARHPEHAGTASGLMSAGCGVGGLLFPLLTGLAARNFSLTTAFLLLSTVALMGALLSAMLPKQN